jgi:beta propeller repeat protein
MKLHALSAVVSMFLVCSTLQADYPVINICVGASDVQTNPDIDGNIVVWEDWRIGTSNAEIYWVNLTDPNLIQNRITQPKNQKYPAVSGNTIVWQDEQVSTNREIYAYDIPSQTAACLTDSAHQRTPDITDGRIVCESFNSGYYNAAVWNPVSAYYELLAPNSATQMSVAIDGSMVVWRDERDGKSQIYACDLTGFTYMAAPVYPAGINQWRPAISQTIVVWEDLSEDAQTTLMAYDRVQNAVVWTYPAAGVFTANMSISKGVIVWQEPRVGGSDYNIRGYDLNSGSFLDIATGIENDQMPVVSGRTVVWQRNGTDIVGAVIPSPSVISVVTPNGGEMFLAGTEIEMVWQMANGEAPEAVDIEFSSDNGVHWVMIADNIAFAEGFVWSPIADIDSQQCLIRVQAADDAQIRDVSNAAFTVFQCSPSLTADLTGDCFVGIEDFAVMAGQWLTCGNPYDVLWCNN